MKLNNCIVIVLFLLLGIRVNAQDIITGKVVNEKGAAVSGASVFIPNTSAGTVTDADGNFSIPIQIKGKIKLAVSFIGYEVASIPLQSASTNKPLLIKLQPKDNALSEVIVRNYDKAGWERWGEVFTKAFIGMSAYSEQCEILNKEIIRFLYNNETAQLTAYAEQPVIVRNAALGYNLRIDLSSFLVNVNTSEVDYQFYTYYMPMTGSEMDKANWKKNREEAYNYSLLYFMRALYRDDLKNKFDIRRLERKDNTEKTRIQLIYQERFEQIKNQLGDAIDWRDKSAMRMIEKTFSKDSLSYYRKVLATNNKTEKLSSNQLSFSDYALRTDSGTVIVKFDQYLLVTLKRKKEPEEYYHYRVDGVAGITRTADRLVTEINPAYPVTELTLSQGLPIEINESGFFSNTNLYINGFWGWWEKIGTRLPYEYQP